MIRKRCISLLLVFCLLSALLPGMCMAAEPQTITMSMQDYNSLKNDYLILKQNNKKQQQLLNQLKEQLTQASKQQNLSNQDWLTLKEQLTEAEKKVTLLENQLMTLQQQLTLAKQSSTTAEQDLQSANQSLNELSKAIKQEQTKLKIQRDIFAVAAIYFAVRK